MSFDCRQCKSWTGCPGREWYSFADIRFCAQHIFWLLKFAWILRQGCWPSPESVFEAGIRGKMPAQAPFEKAVLVIAELDKRLIWTGWRGKLLREECINREKMDYLSDDAKDALYYVAGWRRKRQSYSAWLKQRRYRVMTTKKYSDSPSAGEAG